MSKLHFAEVAFHSYRTVFGLSRELYPATIGAATSPLEEHVDGTRYFLADAATEHGVAGFAIRGDGELVYVFSTRRGNGAEIMAAANAAGATHLDCFDGYLVEFYMRHGFERVTSVANWDPEGPRVVYMARPGHFLRALDRAEQDIDSAN